MRWTSLLSCIVFAMVLAACAKTTVVPAAEDPALTEVRSVLTRYFKVWSDKDMDAYGALFDPGASIAYVEDGRANLFALDVFLDSQRLAHVRATVPMVETPDRMEIHLSPDGRVAQAAVKWKLLEGGKSTIGWDYFTLKRDADNSWHILTLMYYAE